jgi:hypothetical protein
MMAGWPVLVDRLPGAPLVLVGVYWDDAEAFVRLLPNAGMGERAEVSLRDIAACEKVAGALHAHLSGRRCRYPPSRRLRIFSTCRIANVAITGHQCECHQRPCRESFRFRRDPVEHVQQPVDHWMLIRDLQKSRASSLLMEHCAAAAAG